MGKKNEILDAYKFRYACKEFDVEKKITEDDFEFILETGRLSPSSFGWEPWKFVVVQNMALREKLKEFAWGAQKQLPTASHFVLLMVRKANDVTAGSDYLNYISKDVQMLPEEIITMKSDFFKNFQENDFDLTNDRKKFDWATKQVYLPFANMMTSAAQIGIDSCPIEGFDQVKMEDLLKSEGVVDTNEFALGAMVAFGYRTEKAEMFPKTRRPMNEVVKWVK